MLCVVSRLNPCCGGRCSSTDDLTLCKIGLNVLILVVVEDVLVLYSKDCIVSDIVVLILVVVEDVLVQHSITSLSRL